MPAAIATSHFAEATTLTEVQKLLSNLSPKTIILLDIDDTIITPLSTTFRADPHRKLIDEFKKNKDKYANYEEIISNWRLKRKTILVDAEWPKLIQTLKKSHSVFGLTKIDSGKFGNISSMEVWRYNELKNHNIEFTDHLEITNHSQSINKFTNNPVFLKGIFITGLASKADVLVQFQDFFKMHSIVLIDDREEHLLDVEKFCKHHNISFLGILFKGIERLPGKPDPRIVDLQKKYLIEKAVWLEDEEAQGLLK